jgi:hypothetical protein
MLAIKQECEDVGAGKLDNPAYYSNRTLKGIYAMDNDYFFTVSPYLSAGIKYGF